MIIPRRIIPIARRTADKISALGFLSQVNSAVKRAGQRLLDIFYTSLLPAGRQRQRKRGGLSDGVVAEPINRVFWTPITWIPVGSTASSRSFPDEEWVTTNYPGTRIGITEYNWGAETLTSTARPPRRYSLAFFWREDLIWPRAGRRLIRAPPTLQSDGRCTATMMANIYLW